ncbi:CHAD domain-containing protein [Seohaeicola saemankumensis]|nr:CHAD domain-containing protein [Seohaeicola saemankumensis]MCA0873299.1 CHAD domain-containing protein [Seohaeicola saemankumensis]
MFLVRGPIDRQMFGKPGGKLVPVWHEDDSEERYVLLDCFDQSIRRSGAVLIEAAGQLTLIGRDGRTVVQPATRTGNFVGDLEPGPVRRALGMVPELRSLLEIGTGKFRQSRLALIDGEQKTHARARFLTLRPETASSVSEEAEITLASVQGLRGYDKAYRALRKKLGAEVKDDGVASALYGGPVAYIAKPDIKMTGDEPAFQAASDIISAYITVARQNEPGIIADYDTEFLHDYRVALRKIRSVLSLFKGVYGDAETEMLKSEFSELMVPTGRMRDLDVYLLDQDHYFEMLPETLHSGLTKMFDLFSKERQAGLRAFTRRLRSSGYNKKILVLAARFADRDTLDPGPNAKLHATDYACALIWKRYRKVCKIASGIDDQTEDEEVHELRIHCKKLRYLMEFFAPLFPSGEIKGLIKPLKRLQDNLGLFNDYSVQQISLQAFLEDHPTSRSKDNLAIAQSIGALTAALHQRQLDERAKVVSNFTQFDSPEVRKKFRSLFHKKGK